MYLAVSTILHYTRLREKEGFTTQPKGWKQVAPGKAKWHFFLSSEENLILYISVNKQKDLEKSPLLCV